MIDLIKEVQDSMLPLSSLVRLSVSVVPMLHWVALDDYLTLE